MPLPDSPHAVSVALPRWQDIVKYEEKDPLLIKSLKAVYPRFGLNPLVAKLAEHVLQKTSSYYSDAWPYPTRFTAELAQKHCLKITPQARTYIKEMLGVSCLLTDLESTTPARAFWQHSGLGLSSRQASIALGIESPPSTIDVENSCNKLTNRLANIYGCESESIRLYPSGMSAFFSALQIINKFSPERPTLQLGFPYVDVLKLPEVVFQGSKLLLTTSPDELIAEIDQRPPAAIIIELPSNPMLQCIDLPLVAEIAHSKGIFVIADDTIGSALNIDALPYADLIFSSLTKSFAGSGDILAGSLVISPHSPWKEKLNKALKASSLTSLGDADSIALEVASRDVAIRMPLLNKACDGLASRLSEHPAVKRVLHPKKCNNYKKLMRTGGGYGCLLSFELEGNLDRIKNFYDSLRVCKGPSLGTRFTLVCPYVMLAHYNELDWAEECGVPSHLLRVSVGLEDPEMLWENFKIAFES